MFRYIFSDSNNQTRTRIWKRELLILGHSHQLPCKTKHNCGLSTDNSEIKYSVQSFLLNGL